MLAVMEESEVADALFFHTVKAAAVVGLYQVFLATGRADMVGGGGSPMARCSTQR